VTLSNFFARVRKHESVSLARTPAGDTHPTKALARFLTGLGAQPQPVLLDLGPVVGANVTFFGEHLGCKIFVEDLSADVDRHVREDRVPDLPSFLQTRFPQAAESFDGIICWDIFDYLDRSAAQALAAQVVRLLRPDGVALAFFNHSEIPSGQGQSPTYTRHAVIDPRTIEHKPYPAARGKQRPVPNRDLQRMFAPLAITDQFLLKTNMREVVFRKSTARA
jgi:SAM-dependent methyltransferase